MSKWIAWHGLTSEAPTDKKMHVLLRNGEDSIKDFPNGSLVWRWTHTQDDSDIVAYKIVEDEKLQEVFPNDTIMPSDISPKPIKSDGGSSDYYKLTITNKEGESIQCETGDVLRAMVGNDYDLSNVIKACRRMYEASQGRGKEGATIEYDTNKIIYFASEFAYWHKQC